jgi:hypothetical protein
MSAVLDWILETHQGSEPRVLTEDVQGILRSIIRPGDDDSGESVSLIAERARVSTRTVYRVLNPAARDDGAPPTISLDLADRLCLAADSHLKECRLYWPDGSVTLYQEVESVYG